MLGTTHLTWNTFETVIRKVYTLVDALKSTFVFCFRGFSKNSTAELMLKRANRMKYNALRKKKLTGKDIQSLRPSKELSLFHSSQKPTRSECFQIL